MLMDWLDFFRLPLCFAGVGFYLGWKSAEYRFRKKIKPKEDKPPIIEEKDSTEDKEK